MRFYYDCEFIESGYGQPLDLISIGFVCEDGRELYCINEDCDWDRANDWVRENVLLPMGIEQKNDEWHISDDAEKYMMPCDLIALNIMKYVKALDIDCNLQSFSIAGDVKASNMYQYLHKLEVSEKPEFWGYYADYDHVILSQLFGTMMDLPNGFPMYTRDIKQWCDQLGNPKLPKQEGTVHHALGDAHWNQQAWEFLKQYEESKHATAQQ